MGGFNPANIDALLAQGPGALGEAQAQSNIHDIVGGANPPTPALATQPGKPTSKLKAVLGNFFTGFALASGIPEAQSDLAVKAQQIRASQQQAKETQARIPLIAEQAKQTGIENQIKQKMLDALSQNGGNMFEAPFASFGQLSPDEQAVKDAAVTQARMTLNPSAVFQGASHIASMRAIYGRQEQQGAFEQAMVTPEMVNAGVPKEWLGTTKPTKILQPYLGRAVFGNVPVQGASGPALLNRNPMSPGFGQTKNLGIGSPANAGAIMATGEGGALIPMTKQQALNSGASMVTTPNATQVMGKQALIDDIKGGIQQLKASSAVIDNPGSKTKIAVALATPGLTTQNFLQQPIMAQMSPEEQNYAIQLLSLKEQAMAMRSVLGAGQGSEDLRKAIQQTIPNASTPNSAYANKQLDQFATTLDRLAKGVPKLTPGQGNAPSKSNAIKIIRDANGRITSIE